VCLDPSAPGTVLRIKALPTALFNGQTPLGMSNAHAMKQLRVREDRNTKIGPCAVCSRRAAPPAAWGIRDMASEVVKIGT
jgi:hypothetical protein